MQGEVNSEWHSHFTGEDTVAGTMGFMPPGGWTRNWDTIGSGAGMSWYLLDLFLVSTQKRGSSMD